MRSLHPTQSSIPIALAMGLLSVAANVVLASEPAAADGADVALHCRSVDITGYWLPNDDPRASWISPSGRESQRPSVSTCAPSAYSVCVPYVPMALLPRRIDVAAVQPAVAVAHRVVSLEMNAEIANWDRDAEWDGLLVHLRPLDAAGNVVPVSGQLALRLIGQRDRRPDRFGRDNVEKFPQLEQWLLQVRQADFQPGQDGVLLQCEFRRIRPEHDAELADEALLTGSLGVSGQGTFSATKADVFIRPYSRFRDEHQLRSVGHERVHPLEER